MINNNSITKIRFYGKHIVSEREREIWFTHPTDPNPFVIDVICGKNRSGKSHILKRISKCVYQHNHNILNQREYLQKKISEDDIDLFVKSFEDSLGKCIYIDDVLLYIKYARSISVRRDSNFRKKSIVARKSEVGNQYILKDALDLFVKDIITSFCSIDESEWETSDDYRESLHENFSNEKIYKINGNIPLIDEINDIFEGHLYFSKRVAKRGEITFELHLVYDQNQCIHYSNWSNGQKVLFISLLIVTYFKPVIFLFDEIENHLHPEYVSRLFKFLKKNVRQSIISTHHPHIIFSKHVDSVWYLEIQKAQDSLPDVLPKGNRLTNKAPHRKVFGIKKNIDKLLYTYKLFDGYDTQLLRLSSASISNLNELVIDVFRKLNHYEVIDSLPNSNPDLQAEKLYDFISGKLVTNEKLNILEIGAGSGRVVKELLKINPGDVRNNINWVLLEPMNQNLNNEISNLSIQNYQVISDLSQTQQKFDFVLFVNVLHELRPNVIAEYLFLIQKNLKQTSDIIVVELYPLLYPEKFSIPMNSLEWAKLFRSLGMSVQIQSLNIKNGFVEAFWLKIRPGSERSFEDIRSSIDIFLKDEILVNRCADYKGRLSFNEVEGDILKTMCELTSVVSISSYFNNQW